jgi:hypothetical protein
MRAISWLVIAVLLVGTVTALGIIPSSKEIMYEPGKEETFQIKVMNNEGAEFSTMVYVEGELAKYITVQEPRVDFAASDDSKVVTLKMKMPAAMEKQGEIPSSIIVREVPKSGGPGMSASLAVTSKLKLRVPYTGKYSEIRLLMPNFVKGEESSFAVEVSNYGDQDIEEAQAFVDIYGPLNNKLFTLTGDKQRVPAREKALLVVKWIPQINDGPYKALATVIYDGKSATDERGFQIGEPRLSIESVSVTDFALGGIAKFDILVSSNWGVAINEAYGWVKVSDDKTTYTSYKTASLAVEPYGKQLFQGYWDTQKVQVGGYKLDILFNYLDKTSQEIYDIVVKPNEISIPRTGMVATEVEASTKTSVKVLAAIIGIVLILTILNTYILWKRLRKT